MNSSYIFYKFHFQNSIILPQIHISFSQISNYQLSSYNPIYQNLFVQQLFTFQNERNTLLHIHSSYKFHDATHALISDTHSITLCLLHTHTHSPYIPRKPAIKPPPLKKEPHPPIFPNPNCTLSLQLSLPPPIHCPRNLLHLWKKKKKRTGETPPSFHLFSKSQTARIRAKPKNQPSKRNHLRSSAHAGFSQSIHRRNKLHSQRTQQSRESVYP